MPIHQLTCRNNMHELKYKLVSGDSELKAAFEVRRQVFVEEQNISEDLTFDDHDSQALHMVVMYGDKAIGTARVTFLSDNQAKLERMAILKHFRRRGIGRRFIDYLIEELSKRQIEQIVLHAQYAVTAFYKSCGFEESGQPFYEAGLKHIKMQKQHRQP
jgi:predicted GNAT family N-acyltransferase